MAGDKANPEAAAAATETAAPCLFLRTKMHYAMTLVGSSSGLPAEDDGDATDATDRFYCQQTMQGFGPDDDLVSPRLCGAGRVCYESSGF